MCGIAGLISRNGISIDRGAIESMTSLVRHRGPDGEGYFCEGGVALGHRRLSILDLSENGAQPMRCQKTNRIITFNGEIYNYLELREQLVEKGYLFISNSDTEVILAAYDYWGASCVSQFNGMWSFAIYDPNEDVIFCSRDRFGVKPFYYVVSSQFFAFGSEIRQVLKFCQSNRVNQSVLTDFIFSSAVECGRETFFHGVEKLLPSHNLKYDLKSHHFEIVRYYELKKNIDLCGRSIEDLVDMYRNCLHESVKIRLRSDVPVGTCLSGGLDSSSIATIASGYYSSGNNNRFSAITAISEDPSNSEYEYAKCVVESAGLNWLTVKPSFNDFSGAIDDVALAQEEPFASPSICMQYFVMKIASENGLKVLLDGQGGDETMLGYERYFAAHFLNVFSKDGLGKMAVEMRAGSKNNAKMRPTTLFLYLLYFSNVYFRYWNYVARMPRLIVKPRLPSCMSRYAKASRDIFELQKLEIEETNLPHLLRYEDKNSMWHSVETRLPFLDYRHVELALSLPWYSKVNQGWTKFLLRKVASSILPHNIAWRRDKKGFEAPNSIWLKRHDNNMLEEVLASKVLFELIDRKARKGFWGKLDEQTRWRLYSVALWERLFHVV